MKKKILIMLSVLISLGLLIVGGFSYYSGQKETQYLTTAVPYVKMVVPELSRWDPVVAKQHMSAEFMQKTSEENFAKIIKALSKIGTLQEMEEPKFEEIYSGDTPAGEKQTVVSYTVKARYDTGDAKITLGLLDQAGEFKVYRFNVESEALAR
jgi:hypothetical protein